MRAIGADEIVIETPEHDRQLEDLSDEQILLVMDAWKQRIEDLKRDLRFKYVSVFKNYGSLAGQVCLHSHSQVSATTFVPEEFSTNYAPRANGFPRRNAAYFATL